MAGAATGTDLLTIQNQIVEALTLADRHRLHPLGIALDQAMQHVAAELRAAGLASCIVAIAAPGADGA